MRILSSSKSNGFPTKSSVPAGNHRTVLQGRFGGQQIIGSPRVRNPTQRATDRKTIHDRHADVQEDDIGDFLRTLSRASWPFTAEAAW